MKKLTLLLLVATLFVSCAHKHKCSCKTGAQAECACCKEASDSKDSSCNCKK